MPFLLAGPVVDVEVRSFKRQNGEVGQSHEVYVLSGREVLQVSSDDPHGLAVGQHVLLELSKRTWDNRVTWKLVRVLDKAGFLEVGRAVFPNGG